MNATQEQEESKCVCGYREICRIYFEVCIDRRLRNDRDL